MEGKNKRNRRNSGSSSVGVGIVAFFLGFLFAIIVLIGSIFGVGYVAVTTDINKVLDLFGLQNVNENAESEDDKYNYINADQAPNVLKLIQKVIGMANNVGDLTLDKIDALAPVTDSVLDFAYKYIDEVVDFDKECFRNVSLVSVLDTVTNSVNYVRTSKLLGLINDNIGNALDDVSNISVVSYFVNGVEAQYATVAGEDTSFKLPVLFDYYVHDSEGIGYNRTISVGGTSAFPANLDPEDYICETVSKDADEVTLYKAYYVPCKVTPTGIEEAEYKLAENKVEEPNVSYTDKNGVTRHLNYTFRTIEYGADTDFIAVKPQIVDGKESFVLDHSAIIAAKNSGSVDVNDRFTNYSYYAPYAINYHTGVTARTENNLIYGVSTINGINYFKDNSGSVIEYDPLTISDVMLSPTEPLNSLPVNGLLNDLVGAGNADMINEVFAGISVGNILNHEVDFDEVIKDIKLSTFLNEVKADDRIMTFIVYNISNVTKDGGIYTAIYDKGGESIPVILEVDESGVIKSMKDGDSKVIKGNTVNDLNTITDGITLDIFLDVKADDAIMAYLGYGISDAVEVLGKDWQYEGTYGEGSEAKTVRIYTDNDGIITKVTDESENEITGTTINEVSDRVNNIMNVLTLPDFIDVKATDPIMAYIGYGITDVEEVTGQAYSYTGTCDGDTVYIYADGEGYVTKVTDTGGNPISGTTIDGVSARVENIMDVLTVPDLMDIDPEEEIMAYLGYGIYDVTASSGVNNGKAYTHVAKYKEGVEEFTVYVASEANVIKSVWKADGTTISGTKADGVSNLLDNVDQALRITEFIDIDADDAIMAYLGYGVYEVTVSSGTDNGKTYTHTGKYDNEGVETAVYIATEGGIITSVWDAENGVVPGTKIGDISTRINSLQDKLTIGDIITVDGSSSKVLQAIADSTISGLNDKINTLTIGDVVEVNESSSKILQALKDTTINGLNDRINTLTIGDVVEVTDSSSMILKALKDTTINGLNDKINTLTIGEIVEVDESSSKILQALQYTTINGIDAKINELTIGEIVEVNESSSKILQAIQDSTINDLDAKIQTLTVSEVLDEADINSNSILIQLKDKNIFDLATEIDKVLVQRIYAANIYGVAENADPTLATTYNSEYLYYERTGNETDGYKYEITTVGCAGLSDTAYDNAVGKLTEEQFNAGEYYTYGPATGMWKLVLYRLASDGTKTEKAYTLNNFNNMVDSCSTTVYNSTLNEFKEAGLIGEEITQTDLDKKLKTVVVVSGIPTIQYIKIVDGHITNTGTESEATPIGDFTLKLLLMAITSSL